MHHLVASSNSAITTDASSKMPSYGYQYEHQCITYKFSCIICTVYTSPASPVHIPASPVHIPASPVHIPASPPHIPASLRFLPFVFPSIPASPPPPYPPISPIPPIPAPPPINPCYLSTV